MPPVHFALWFKRSYYAYASQHSLCLILTEEALYSTEIATETSLIEPEVDAKKRILQRNFLSHLNSWTKYHGVDVSHDSFVKAKAVLPQANDVEENRGPTIFEVIDSTRTVFADYNQGNEVLFGENAGKQCEAMSFTAITVFTII